MTIAFEKPQFITHFSKSIDFTIYDVKWIPCSARFVVTGQNARGQGVIQTWALESEGIRKLQQQEKPFPFKCSTFDASSLQSRHLATGDFDGKLALWNLERLEPIFNIKAHESIINCIDGCGGQSMNTGPPEICTGGKDGMVHIWDVRQRDSPVTTIKPKEGEILRDVWSVGFGNSFNDEERMICIGYDNGDVKMVDLRNMKVYWESNLKNGICSLQFDRKDIKMNKLVITTLEEKVHVYDLKTLNPDKGFANLIEKGKGTTTTWLVKHLPQNRDCFITSSGNGELKLYKYNYPNQRIQKTSEGIEEGIIGNLELLNNSIMAQQPISCFDWNPDKLGLCVFGAFDQTLRIGLVTKLNSL